MEKRKDVIPVKKRGLIYAVMQVFLFIAGAFGMWRMLYYACNLIGSVVSGSPYQARVEQLRVVPAVIITIAYVYAGLKLFDIYRAEDPRLRRKRTVRGGITLIVLGAATLGYIAYALAAGILYARVEGYPTPLYPLDAAIMGAVLCAAGIRLLTKGGGGKPAERTLRGRCGPFLSLSYLVALCSGAACLYAPFVLDFTRGSVFFNIMLWLNYLVPVAMAAYYRFVYAPADEEKRTAICLEGGIGFLCANAVLLMLYCLSVDIHSEAPSMNALGLLPIEFTASLNAFPFVVGGHNLLAPLFAIAKGLWRKSREARTVKI